MSRLHTLRLVWPREVTAEQLMTAMRLLASVSGTPLVLEAVGHPGRVEHWLHVRDGRTAGTTTQMRACVPGLGIEGAGHDDATDTGQRYDRAIELRLSTARRSVMVERADVTSRAVLTALSHVGKDETLLLQWVLLRPLSPSVVPNKIDHLQPESVLHAVLRAPFTAPGPADTETRNALRDKRSEAGWRAVGRIAVRAASRSRQEQLMLGLLQALRTAEAPGVTIKARTIRPSRVLSVGRRARTRLNASELATLASWPVGPTADLPVVRLGSRRLPVPKLVPGSGRVIGRSTWPGKERSLALSPADSLRHLHVLGPTGVGKSTLLLNLICQDMAAGRTVVVIEPKGDLIRDVLARVPAHRADDVVLLDPTDNEMPVGLNPLAVGRRGGSAELVADQLLATFHGLYAAHWGPRTSDILHASLLTLARTPGMSLVALPLLLGNPAFRRSVVGKLNDPIGLGPFWAAYEAWSEAERITATAPVMNKLRPFLVRSTLRRIIGQAEPKFDMRSVFAERKILLCNLAKGQLGPEAAALLGSLVLSTLWRTAQSRLSMQPERRAFAAVYIDEFQDYLHLPTDLGEALAQARSLGIGFTLAHQHLGQLTPSMRDGVLANARSRICFQLETADARTMAASSTLLDAEDFAELNAFHYYTQLVADSAVQPWCSGRSMPPSKPTGHGDLARAASRKRYGVAASDIDRNIEELISRGGRRKSSVEDLVPRRRGGQT